MDGSTWDSSSFEAARFEAGRSQLPVPEDSSLTVGCLSGTVTGAGAGGSCPQAGPRLPVAGKNDNASVFHVMSHSVPVACLTALGHLSCCCSRIGCMTLFNSRQPSGISCMTRNIMPAEFCVLAQQACCKGAPPLSDVLSPPLSPRGPLSRSWPRPRPPVLVLRLTSTIFAAGSFFLSSSLCNAETGGQLASVSSVEVVLQRAVCYATAFIEAL